MADELIVAGPRDWGRDGWRGCLRKFIVGPHEVQGPGRSSESPSDGCVYVWMQVGSSRIHRAYPGPARRLGFVDPRFLCPPTPRSGNRPPSPPVRTPPAHPVRGARAPRPSTTGATTARASASIAARSGRALLALSRRCRRYRRRRSRPRCRRRTSPRYRSRCCLRTAGA